MASYEKIVTHAEVLTSYLYVPPPPPGPVSKATPTVSPLQDIADALHITPPLANINSEYLNRVVRAAAYLGNPVPGIVLKAPVNLAVPPPAIPPSRDSGQARVVVIAPPPPGNTDIDPTLRNSVMAARNNVFDVVNRVNSFIARAKAVGLAPPDNPFSVITQLNSQRNGLDPLNIDSKLSSDLVVNIGAYVDLLKAEAQGQLNLEKNATDAAQLSSIHMSFEGFGGSGNAGTDLMRFLPSIDAIKEQKAAEALSVLDFTKRIPKVVFTANYAPDGIVKGSIVGFQKIPDASGYIIKRRNIFDGTEVAYTITNEDLNVRWNYIKDYVNVWIMTFYKTLDQANIFAFLDGDVQPNAYYVYKIQAYQIQNQIKGSVFSVDTAPIKLSQAQRLDLTNQLLSLEIAQGRNTISPYPLLARQILNNDQLDWVLAGTNVRTSISRSDNRTITRQFSYVSAQLAFIFDQMDQGKFVIPKDVNQVIKNVTDSIAKFGVMQTVQEVVEDTGILYYFEGKDPKEDTHFDRVGTTSIDTSNLLSIVASAIDPETAILDLQSLATNLPQLLDSGIVGSQYVISPPGTKAQAQSSEIDIPTGTTSEDEIKFLQTLGDLTGELADLTTFDGISKFTRTIRIFSDIGPNRGAPLVAPPVKLAPDPLPTPIPPQEARPKIGSIKLDLPAFSLAQAVSIGHSITSAGENFTEPKPGSVAGAGAREFFG